MTSDVTPFRTLAVKRPRLYCAPAIPIFSARQSSQLERFKVPNRWAGYFEQVLKTDPTALKPISRDVATVVADPTISCDPPDLRERMAAGSQLRSGKAVDIHSFVAFILRAGVAYGVPLWRTSIIPSD